jgi:nucleoside 2-deoxyribosyltransferase
MRVYLAGPDVFLPNAHRVGEEKKAICHAHGLDALWPLDATHGLEDAVLIFEALVAMIDLADAGIANCTPWRGSGADPGTAFEIGYLHAQGKPIHAYTNDARELAVRVEPDGHVVEQLGLSDNLMLEGPALVAGRRVVQVDARPDELWTDLRGFEACVRALADGA